MAEGKITVSNFSEQSLNVQVWGAVASGHLVASGALPSGQTSGFVVSGYNEYRVNFFTVNRSPLTASNLAPESIVQVEINGG
jgi:hypothetical protein